jgi:hypothetical protein
LLDVFLLLFLCSSVPSVLDLFPNSAWITLCFSNGVRGFNISEENENDHENGIRGFHILGEIRTMK